jgi:hypothetical protein
VEVLLSAVIGTWEVKYLSGIQAQDIQKWHRGSPPGRIVVSKVGTCSVVTLRLLMAIK